MSVSSLPSAIVHSYDEARSHLGGVLFDAGAPYSAIGKIGDSCTINVSFTPRSEWPGGIFENSRYAKIIIHADNKQIVHLRGWQVLKLRSRKVTSFEHLCQILAKWVAANKVYVAKEAQS
jgi:hypothetical protein